MTKVIDSFSGEHFFLSSFYQSDIVVGSSTFATAEHLFQSFKCKNDTDKIQFSKGYKLTAGQAKQAGRLVALRSDWEFIKDSAMFATLLLKFSPGTELAKKLLATGDAELVEGNHWGDTYWGVCGGVGENKLGVLLMFMRNKLNAAKG